MAGRVLDIETVMVKDGLANSIALSWNEWDNARQPKMAQWRELRNKLYATDTSTTSNSTLPWKNKTTTPKLTQIRDNLYANYLATMFPKRRCLIWEGKGKDDETAIKKDAIESYIFSRTQVPEFKQEISKLILDYIDFGNCFASVEFVDERYETEDGLKVGDVGPIARRISPSDIVFNPLSPSFRRSPKIVRSFITMGELKDTIESFSADTENGIVAKTAFDYFKNLRQEVANYAALGNFSIKGDYFSIDGFGSLQDYLSSNYVELLTFYGDIYDETTGEFLKGRKIVVADRHKVIYNEIEKSIFGTAPIFHAGWRVRQDNLWAMGPLDNLVGMQYRIDHLENLKADCFDLIAFPVLKVKGAVQDFDWGPFERIFVGDDGDVEVLSPDAQALNANLEISTIEQKMEEMAGAPKEAMGFRTPGEKTMYEVQRLENAASRVFQNKIGYFEEQILEPVLNAMLELARRNSIQTEIRTVDPSFNMAVFKQISVDDLTSVGRLRPVAARHFAERAEQVQNMNSFSMSPHGQDPDIMAHFSAFKLAKFYEEMLSLEDWDMVAENVRVSEKLETQRLANSANETLFAESQTPSGLTEGDTVAQ